MRLEKKSNQAGVLRLHGSAPCKVLLMPLALRVRQVVAFIVVQCQAELALVLAQTAAKYQ